MTLLSSSFKKHLKEFHLDLSKKAGTTRKVAKSKFGLDSLYKMSSNENPLGPSPKAMEAIARAIPSICEYGYKSDHELIEALSDHFDSRLHPEQFITGNGALEVLERLAQTFLEPGLECIITTPSFHIYELFGVLTGSKVKVIPLKSNYVDLDLDKLFQSITDKTRLIILSNPNNPVGSIIPKAQIDILVEHVPDHVIVVHDEVYYHFIEDDNFSWAMDYVEQGKNVVGLHSFSKGYGMAGIRLGYGFSTPEISQYLRKTIKPFNINTLSMAAGLGGLNDFGHLFRSRQVVLEGKAYLTRIFDELGITYYPSHTNFILFKCPGPVDDMIQFLMNRGIMVRAGSINGADGCIRLTIGLSEANEAFAVACRDYVSRMQ